MTKTSIFQIAIIVAKNWEKHIDHYYVNMVFKHILSENFKTYIIQYLQNYKTLFDFKKIMHLPFFLHILIVFLRIYHPLKKEKNQKIVLLKYELNEICIRSIMIIMIGVLFLTEFLVQTWKNISL